MRPGGRPMVRDALSDVSPLVVVAAGWLGGALLAGLMGGAPLLQAAVAATGAVAAGAVGAVASRARPLRPVVWSLLALGAGCAGMASRPSASPPPAPPPGLARLTAVVEGRAPRSNSFTSTVRVSRGARVRDGATVPRGTRVRLRDAELPVGARVRVLARLQPRTRFRNPTPHPPWPRWDAVHATGRMPKRSRARVLSRDAASAALADARERVRSALTRSLSPRTAGLARALVLGERGAVPRADREAVRGAGLAHVLAVSGLHVAIVAGLWVLGLQRVLARLPRLGGRFDVRRIACATGLPIAFGYAAFAGGAPSAWRAAVTASIGWGLVAAGRRPRPAAVVAAAALLLGSVQPGRVTDPGFLLSVLAVAAIVAAPAAPGRSMLVTTALVSARATIATAPVVLWCFGRVPLAGLVANALLVPLGSMLLVPLAVGHAAVAVAWPALAPLSASVLGAVADAFLTGCEVFAAVPVGKQLPPPSVAQGVALTAGCAGAVWLRRWRWRLSVVAAATLALVALEGALRHSEKPREVLRATMLDVGQGDATLLDLPDGRAMVIDTGGAVLGGPDPGRHVLQPLLRARRRSRIDVVAITHAHPDHDGGLEALADAVDIGELWISGQAVTERPDGRAARLVERLRQRGTRIRDPPQLCDGTHRFGRARVQVLWPCPHFDAGFGLNDNSLVLRVRLDGRSMLFAGDVEHHAEAELVRRNTPLRADVLQVPHHGSRTSSTPAFVDAVRPALAVISCGVRNRFGHPSGAVVARWQDAGARVLRTDRVGGVIVTTDGRGLEASTWSGRRLSWPGGSKARAP